MWALRDRALFFVHIPKTAGTSLRQLLLSQFSPGDTLLLAREQPRQQRDEKIAAIADARFVYGHIPYVLAERFPRRPFIVTFLRDPVSRAVSAFHELRRQASRLDEQRRAGEVSPAYAATLAAAARLSLAEFVRREPLAASRHLGNVQTWFLSASNLHERFDHREGDSLAVTREGLELAKARLRACDAIGLTERMTASLDFLFYALRTPPLGEITFANRTSDADREKMGPLDPDTRAALLDLTSIDGELYTFARDLFESRHREMIRQLLTEHAHRGQDGEAGHEADRQHGRDESASAGRARHPAGTARSVFTFAADTMRSVFTFDEPVPGDGWYGPEFDGRRSFCWTGPDRTSTIELASPPDAAAGRDIVLTIGIAHTLDVASLSAIDVRINDVRLPARVELTAEGHVLTAAVPRPLLRTQGESNWIALRVPHVILPSSVDPTNRDTRLLGIAVHRVELATAVPA